MELRLLLLAMRLLDPRRWRARLLQLAGLGAAGVWITARAVSSSDEVRAVRDARHAKREEQITATITQRELEFRQGRA